MPKTMLLHASCTAFNDKAVLLVGVPGAGKSDLALRLIMDHGAQLIADDQTQLIHKDGQLIASAPATIAGLIEVRHLGLMRLPHAHHAPVALYVELTNLTDNLERLPEKAFAELEGCRIPRLRLPAFAASTPAKIKAFLAYPLDN